jgi:hypothetical protein
VKSPAPGMRTFAFGLAALVFLLVGLSLGLAWPKAAEALWTPYVAGVCTVFLGVAGKHLGESLATGTGIAGAVKTLLSAEKPTEAKP